MQCHQVQTHGRHAEGGAQRIYNHMCALEVVSLFLHFIDVTPSPGEKTAMKVFQEREYRPESTPSKPQVRGFIGCESVSHSQSPCCSPPSPPEKRMLGSSSCNVSKQAVLIHEPEHKRSSMSPPMSSAVCLDSVPV